MPTEINNETPFQTQKSMFAETVKFLVLDIARNISHLEDHIQMMPAAKQESHSERDSYRDFRRVFRDLHILTYNIIKYQELKQAASHWFQQPYIAETKREYFSDGMGLAQLYITEMFTLGLLDLNVPQPCAFPYGKLLRDYYLEQAKAKQEMEVTHAIV